MNGQLSRISLLYFLAVFTACLLLLSIFMPWWLLPFSAICLFWRSLVFVGRLSFPSVWVKAGLVSLSGLALFMQYGLTVSLDVFIMLLLLGFSLKLLELYHTRDAQLLLYLSFFVLMTVFLYEQSFSYVLLVFAVALLVLSAIVAIHSAESELQQQWSQPLRKAVLVTVLATPVMMFMFVAIPRLPPLWSMPLQKQQSARTGMSDSMSPGDISLLTQSADLAFRATFSGAVPDRRDLYWYGMILDHFDGMRWTDSCMACVNQRKKMQPSPKEMQSGNVYQVILEPHGFRWVYVLFPSLLNDPAINVSAEGIASYHEDVIERQTYQATYLDSSPADKAILGDKSRYLALPAESNPRARQLALRWLQESGAARDIVQRALAYYHDAFFYTLQPPALNDQRVDDFLFRTRSGFCEHFASSFVFLMRAAGIPARVVVGYLGGEINEQERYVTVRQYDAHAWAEVWLPDSGWVRVDPTAAVAPDRIDLGFFATYSNDSNFAGDTGLAAFHNVPLLNKLRLQLDRFDYLWSRWVLGYESEQQRQLLTRWGLLSPLRIAFFGAGIVIAAFIILCFYLYWREWWSSTQHRATRQYRQLCHVYALLGLDRQPVETPLQYAEKISAAGFPGAEQFMALSKQYYAWLYLDAEPPVSDPAPDFMLLARKLYWRLLFHCFKARFLYRS